MNCEVDLIRLQKPVEKETQQHCHMCPCEDIIASKLSQRGIVKAYANARVNAG